MAPHTVATGQHCSYKLLIVIQVALTAGKTDVGTRFAILFCQTGPIGARLGNRENIMAAATIQDWTDTQVLLKYDEQRDVRYRVIRQDGEIFLEMCDADNAPIHTLEIPDGMKLDRNSYEVLLRYVLLDVVAA